MIPRARWWRSSAPSASTPISRRRSICSASRYANPEVGKKDDARKAWKKAPHVKEAQLALGVDAYEGGDLDEAVKRLKGAAGLDAAYQAAYYQLGLVYKEQGDNAGAREAWQRAARIDPKSDLGALGVDQAAGADRQRQRAGRGAGGRLGVGRSASARRSRKQVSERWGRMNDRRSRTGSTRS